jgi:hypothetical protein
MKKLKYIKLFENFRVFESVDLSDENVAFFESGDVGGYFTVKYTGTTSSRRPTYKNLSIKISAKSKSERQEASNEVNIKRALTGLFAKEDQNVTISRFWGNEEPRFKQNAEFTISKDILKDQNYRVKVECNNKTFYIQGREDSSRTFEIEVPSNIKLESGEKTISEASINGCFIKIRQIAQD